MGRLFSKTLLAFKRNSLRLLKTTMQPLLVGIILVSNIGYPALVIAQDLEVTPPEETLDIPIDESEDILEEGISTSTLEEETEIPESTYVDGVYTVNSVKLEEYTYPGDSLVRVKFTKLNEEGNLVIKKVSLTDKQQEELQTSQEFAWDITSSMTNGTFEYDLTLPNDLGNDVEVKYSEDGEKYSEVENELVKDNYIKIEGLNHFTLFIITFEDPQDPAPTNPGYNDEWFDYGGEITQVPSGTHGITSAQGDYHAEISGGAFTRYNGYTYTFPELGYDAKVDVYLNMSEADGSSDKRFDFSSAISNTSNQHRRDFIFSLGTNPSTAGQWLVSASNNAPGWPGNPGRSPITLTETGWYTLEHQFRENSSHELVVTMNIYKKGNSTPLGSWILTNPTDIIGSTVGGNRYGWFIDTSDFDYLAIDNSILADVVANTAPVVIIEDPTPALDSYVKGIITGRAIAKDDSGIGSYYLRFWQDAFEISGGGTLRKGCQTAPGGSALGTMQDVSCEFDTTQFSDGKYVFSAQFLDSDSKWGIAKREFFVDNTRPVVEVTQPLSDSINKSPIIISGTATDNLAGIKNVALHIYKINEDTSKTLVPGCTTLPGIIDGNDWSLTINRSSSCNLEDGKYEIAAWAYDNAGNPGWAPRIQFNVDDTKPTATINGEEPKSLYNGNKNISVHAIDNNYSRTEIYKNGESAPFKTYTGAWFGLSWLAEGNYKIIVIDKAGNSTEYAFTIDRTAPTVPANGVPHDTIINTNNFDFNWDDSTDAHLITYEFQSSLNPNQTDGVLTTGLWKSGVLPTSMIHSSGAPDGTWYWQVRAIDEVGNASNWSEIWNVTIDTTAPSTPEILLPLENQFLNSTPILNDWTDSTDTNGISEYRVEYQYDDGHTFPNAPYRMTTASQRNHTPGTWEEGGVKYRVQAIDLAGNVSGWSEWRHYTYDITDPEVTFEGIRYINSTTVDSTSTITNDNTPIIIFTATDSLSGIKEASVNGYSATYDGTYWVAPITTPLVPDGNHTLEIKATDNAGNETTVNQDIFIDTNAPTAAHTYYKDNMPVTGTAYVKGVNQLSFTAKYFDNNPSSGLLKDSYVIFDSNEEGTARTSKAYCGWRVPTNTLMITGDSQDSAIPFTNCEPTLPDGEYFMYHQVYDNATRKDIPSITQFRDVKGIHFVVDNVAPAVPTGMSFMQEDSEEVKSCGGWSTSHKGMIIDWADNTEDDISHYEYISYNADGSTGPMRIFTTSNFDASWWTVPQEGKYGFKIRAIDKAGNMSAWTEICDMNVDWTLPEVAGTSDVVLNEGDTLPTTKLVNVTDNYGVDGFCFQIENSIWGTTRECIHPSTFTKNWDVNVAQIIIDKINEKINPESTTIADTSLIPEGNYIFSYKTLDFAGNESLIESFTVTINNVTPDVLFAADKINIAEGDTVNFYASFTDPSDTGSNTPDDGDWTYTFKTGTGVTTNGTITNPGVISDMDTLTHQYLNEGTYTAQFTVCEATDPGENECTTEDIQITVNNNTPSVSVNPNTILVGTGEALVLSASTTSGNAPYTYLWSGACSGTDTTATVNTTTPGTYVCTVTVTDNDGDSAVSNSVVTVQAPAVLGATTVRNTNTTYQGGVGGPDEALTEEELLAQTTDQTQGDVKGAQTCEDTKKLFGYIYVDKDENNNKDDKETTFENISVRIYTEDNDGETTITTVTTNKDGYWETELCPGTYKIEIDKTNLPKNYDTKFGDVLGVSIPETADEVQANILISDNRNFWQKNWPWIVLGLGSLFVVSLLLIDRKRTR